MNQLTSHYSTQLVIKGHPDYSVPSECIRRVFCFDLDNSVKGKY